MQTEREYAISLGLARQTRGRMSAEAHAAIAEAKAKGMVFAAPAAVKSGSVNANPLPAERPAAEPSAEKVPGIFESYSPTPNPGRSGYLLFKKANGGTIRVNATEACIDCKISFSYDFKCQKPRFRDWRTGDIFILED